MSRSKTFLGIIQDKLALAGVRITQRELGLHTNAEVLAAEAWAEAVHTRASSRPARPGWLPLTEAADRVH